MDSVDRPLLPPAAAPVLDMLAYANVSRTRPVDRVVYERAVMRMLSLHERLSWSEGRWRGEGRVKRWWW